MVKYLQKLNKVEQYLFSLLKHDDTYYHT